MTVTADIITARKLAIVRRVYLEGTRQRAKATPVSRLLAVIHYDLAIETALKAAIRALDPAAPLKSDLAELVTAAEGALAKHTLGNVPRAASIKQVRIIRNAAQHEGRLPTPQEEDECHAITRPFLDEFLAQVWASPLDSVSLGELVLDPACKKHLNDAESHYTAGEFDQAVAEAAEALAWALLRVKNSLVGRGDTWARAIMTSDAFGEPRASRDLTQSIERTQETVLYLALGLDYGEYARFRATAGTVTFMMGGSASHWGAKESLDQSDAEYAIGYASEAVAQIEGRVGSIEKPFGREHWY
jgi:hypothetical protein